MNKEKREGRRKTQDRRNQETKNMLLGVANNTNNNIQCLRNDTAIRGDEAGHRKKKPK